MLQFYARYERRGLRVKEVQVTKKWIQVCDQ